jgi:hypothetical protein
MIASGFLGYFNQIQPKIFINWVTLKARSEILRINESDSIIAPC